MRPRDPIERMKLKSHVMDNGCIEYTGGISKGGYGYFTVKGKATTVHRWAYMLHVGPIPDGYEVDHLCRNTRCINPKHLEAVTPYENNFRSSSVGSVNRVKTHCKRGHELTPDNIIWHGKYGTGRMCLRCNRDRKKTPEYLRQMREQYRAKHQQTNLEASDGG